MRYSHRFVLASMALAACAPPPAPTESVSQANFVNGGFEAGNLGSWLVTSALWGTGAGTVGFVTFPPRTLTDLNLTGAGTALSAAVTAGIPTELTAPDSLRLPFFGVDSAKVNSPIGGAGNHNSNYVQQTMTTTVADVDATDGRIHVRFAAAPVLDFPTPAHNPDQQPYFFIEVRNTTKNVSLYNTFNFSNQPGVIWKTAAAQFGGSPVLYTDWAAFDLAPGPSGIAIGDMIQATVVATGCSFNAHFGEVYVDEFGTSFPYPNVSVTAPNFVAANNDLTYTVTAKNNSSGSATGVIVNISTPPVADSNLAGVPRVVNTTYVSASAPGAACNSPTVGSANQTLTCNIGNLGPGQSYTFTVTVHVPVIPGSHTAPDFVNQGLYNIQTDQRPTPLGGGLVQTQVSATTVVGLQTTLSDNRPSVTWGQASDTYTLTVTNFGPVASNGVVITDARPAQLTSPTWTCVGAGGGVCNLAGGSGALNTTANLPVGASVTYSIATSVIAGVGNASFTYTATATPPAGQVQSTLFNNIGTDTDTVSPALFTLSAAKNPLGNGTGAIVSVPSGTGGINCGANCAQDFASGTLVALTAFPTAGSVWSGWTGGASNPCNGQGNPCTVTVSAAATVTARFDMPSLVTALVTTSNGGSQNVRPGDTAVYSMKLSIPAGSSTVPIKITDLFPAGMNYSSATATTLTGTGVLTCSVGACAAPTIVTGATTTWDYGTVSCSAAGPCEINLTVTGRVATTATRGTTLIDSIGATLLTAQLQPTLTVIEPNLTVSRSVAPASGLVRGQPETVTVTLANNTGGANSDAFDTVVTFPIPAGYTGGGYVASTCPVATASFTGGNATFTLPTGAAGAITTNSTCTFTYQLTGNANATGNATVSLPAGTATSQSITGANPPAKVYTTNPPAMSFGTAAIVNGGNCALLGECVSMICDTDLKCGYADGDGPCTMLNSVTVCRSGLCSNLGLCLPAGACFVDSDCNTATQFCNTQSKLCTPKLPNSSPIPTITGHTPVLDGTCTAAVATVVCVVGACDPADSECGIDTGHGPCASGTVCRSTFCSASGLCGPLGGCLVDADCDTTKQFCNTESSLCTDKIPNGGPVPTVAGHAPPLAGQCNTAAAMVACVSAVCDTADSECGYANGHGSCDPSTAMRVCRSGVCGTDGLCGYPDGQGPCDGANAAQVCRGGMCQPSQLCGTGCKVDPDCDTATQFCNTASGACAPKLDNGQPIPTISGHTPPLDGMCSTAEARVVCKSAVCDPADQLCGYANGSQPCTPEDGALVCRSGACGQTGQCAQPGVTYGLTGGGFSCAMGTGSASPLALCLGVLLLVGFFRRRRAR